MKKPVQKAIIALVLIVVVFYAGCQFYLVNFSSYSTELAVVTTVYDSISGDALFVRDEQAVGTESPGVVVNSVEEGAKVSTGGEIAKVFASETDAANYVKRLELEKKQQYFENLQSMTLGEASDVQSLDAKIFEDVGALVKNKNLPNLKSAQSAVESLGDVLTRRQIITGTEIDFQPIIDGLKSEASALSSSKSVSSITTALSGNFFSHGDGLESSIDYAAITQVSMEQLKTYTALTQGAAPSFDGIGRIMNSFNWYLVMEADMKKSADFLPGEAVYIDIGNDRGMSVEGVIEARNYTAQSDESCVLVIRCTQMNEALAALRKEAVTLKRKKGRVTQDGYTEQGYTGYKINKKAIYTVDGQQGVYVLLGNIIKFRNIDIIYEADDYIISARSSETASDLVQLYDQIIVGGRDLYDGKYTS